MYYELQPSKGCSLYEPYVSCREKKNLHWNGLERLEGASSSVFQMAFAKYDYNYTDAVSHIILGPFKKNYHF